MQTARLGDIVRQRDPALNDIVEQLARGNVGDAVNALDAQGGIHEIVSRKERLTQITREYAEILSPKFQNSGRPQFERLLPATNV